MDSYPLACVFPGQGSQKLGMGRQIAEMHPEVRATFEEADAILDMRLSTLCFEGPAETLNQIEYAQPAIITFGVAAVRLLAILGIPPAMVGGVSLGEYAALVAAGVLTLADALRIVGHRARCMDEADRHRPGRLGLITGVDEIELNGLCQEAQPLGYAAIAVYYSPDVRVVSGDAEAVEYVIRKIRVGDGQRQGKYIRGARMIRRAHGAFHTPLMEPIRNQLQPLIQETHFEQPRIPVVSSLSGELVTTGEACRQLLLDHITTPVRWNDAIQTMVSQGVRHFVEAGASVTLPHSIASVLADARYLSAGHPQFTEEIAGWARLSTTVVTPCEW